MLNTSKLAAKFLWRELRAGEWFIILLAIFLAVSSVTALHFYIDRISRGIDQQAGKMLGGDLVITSPTLIPNDWKEKAKSFDLEFAEMWSYPTVISLGNKLQLADLHAVSENYPLKEKHFRPNPHSI